MRAHSDLRNRRYAGSHARERAVGKIIDYLFFVLPRLLYWHTVKFIATALHHLTKLSAAGVNRLLAHRQAKATPAIAVNPQLGAVTEQLRVGKRRQHDAAMEDWDREWASLMGSGSILEPGKDVVFSAAQHQSVKADSSNDDVLGGVLNDEQSDRHRAVLARFHTDVVKLHEARVAQAREDSRPALLTEDQLACWVQAFRKAYEDAGQLLSGDPRTMWAWADYVDRPLSLPVSSEDAQQVLAAIPPGDHVEIFGAVAVYKGYPQRSKNTLPRETRFAARTFDLWILPSQGLAAEAETIPASDTKWYCSMGGSVSNPVAESSFTLSGGRHLTAYTERGGLFDRFHEGAGRSILRLPDNPLTPFPPELGTGRPSPSPETASTSRLLGDWHTAEDVALWHMSGPLGFFGSRLTGGVSDRGVDVEHPEAVAQVKMQATPVGSPQVRQLRGARPHLGNHVFYSTSGFTRAAIAEAGETGVALFILGDDATVRPDGSHAKRLILDGHRRHGGDDALVAGYINSVTERVRKAQANYGLADGRTATDAWSALHAAYSEDRHRLTRAESYLEGAVEAVKRHPRIGSETHKAIVSHFRNTDLKAAFFCQVLGLPYPGDAPLSRSRRRLTADDFY